MACFDEFDFHTASISSFDVLRVFAVQNSVVIAINALDNHLEVPSTSANEAVQVLCSPGYHCPDFCNQPLGLIIRNGLPFRTDSLAFADLIGSI